MGSRTALQLSGRVEDWMGDGDATVEIGTRRAIGIRPVGSYMMQQLGARMLKEQGPENDPSWIKV